MHLAMLITEAATAVQAPNARFHGKAWALTTQLPLTPIIRPPAHGSRS